MKRLTRKRALKTAYAKVCKRFRPGVVQLEPDRQFVVAPDPDGPLVFIGMAYEGRRRLYRVGAVVTQDVDWEAHPGALLFLLCENSMLGWDRLQIAGGQLQLERLLDVETSTAKQLGRAIESIGDRAKRVTRDLQLLGVLAEKAE